MNIFTPEVASKYGALDSDAFADGEALSAHLLRALAMSGNRLSVKGQTLCSLLWPRNDTTTNSRGSFAGKIWPWWQRLMLPFPVPKRGLLNRASGRVLAKFTDEAVVSLQIATTARPFRADADATHPNVVTMTGDGTATTYSFSDLEISEGTMERFELWIRGESVLGLGDTGTYGTPSNGPIIIRSNAVYPGVTSWTGSDTAVNWADGGHLVELVNSSDRRLVSIRRVSFVGQDGDGDFLNFEPALTPGELSIVSHDPNFRILKVGDFDFYNIAIAATERDI